MQTVPLPPSPEQRPARPHYRLLFLLLVLVWTGITSVLLYFEGSEVRGEHPLLFRVLTASLGSVLLVPLWFVRPRMPKRRGSKRGGRRFPFRRAA
jgi:hypothetical protein